MSVIELSVRPHTACSVTHSPARCSQSEKTRRSIINIQDGVFCARPSRIWNSLLICVTVLNAVFFMAARGVSCDFLCVRQCQCADVHVHLQRCAMQPCYSAGKLRACWGFFCLLCLCGGSSRAIDCVCVFDSLDSSPILNHQKCLFLIIHFLRKLAQT